MDELYNDKGNVVFEWIGSKSSLINETGGIRGQNRTSINAYIIAVIDGKITQLLIEWKFTETYHGERYLNKFSGGKVIERLGRYSSILANWRKAKCNGRRFEGIEKIQLKKMKNPITYYNVDNWFLLFSRMLIKVPIDYYSN